MKQEWIPEQPIFELFHLFEKNPYPFLIYQKRFCLMGSNPFLIFRSKGNNVSIEMPNGTRKNFKTHNPFFELKKLFKIYAQPHSTHPFFQGGLVGYFGYDLGRTFEKIPSLAIDDENLPDILVGFYDRACVFDRFKNEGWLTAISLPKERKNNAIRKIASLREVLESSIPKKNFSAKLPREKNLKSNFTKSAYLSTVLKIKEYIAQGDIYQANLSQRFEASSYENDFALFKALYRENPAPFASFFKTPEFSLLSLSPEQFLKIDGRSVTTCPIKGTRPRGKTLFKDGQLKQELINSPKDDSELLMIVDLERNDLGKVCEFGSIKVSNLKQIEEHSNVFHLVATVKGILRKNVDHFDCLKALFPGGSITGAPKIRAMEIIEELEPTRRNLYTGSFGYMGFNQISDLSILIRTLIKKNHHLWFQVGGGIVADSDPESEFKETLAKGHTFFKVLKNKHLLREKKMPKNMIYWNGSLYQEEDTPNLIEDRGLLFGDGIFESMRAIQGHILGLSDHLDRLFLGLKTLKINGPWNSENLESIVKNTIQKSSFKDCYIRINITRGRWFGEIMPNSSSQPNLIIICRKFIPHAKLKNGIKTMTLITRRNETSPLCRIKTLNYLENILGKIQAREQGFEDGVFLNTKGRLTEATSSNIFLIQKGGLITPPTEDGALPGIIRKWVLEKVSSLGLSLKIRSIAPDEIHEAQEAFLTNSVLGIVPWICSDRKKIGNGRPGPITKRIQKAFTEDTQKNR